MIGGESVALASPPAPVDRLQSACYNPHLKCWFTRDPLSDAVRRCIVTIPQVFEVWAPAPGR